jgi:GntR family transcriptional regulator, transcriptional repressor for pyruvate dehydrogenase complex
MSPALPIAAPRRRSLAETAVDSITARIRNGIYRPGEKLPTEPQFMADLGVSRTVVREAVSRLQAAGLVETKHGIGTFVLEVPANPLDIGNVVTVRDVLAMLELRISLETEAAALAALRRQETHLEEMRGAIDELEADIAAERNGVTADFRFHLQIALATGNRYFESVFRNLGTSTIPRTRLDTARITLERSPSYLHRTNLEHQAILDGIARRDPEAARAAMRMHLSNSRERLRHVAGVDEEA